MRSCGCSAKKRESAVRGPRDAWLTGNGWWMRLHARCASESQPSSNCLRTRNCAAPCATCGQTPDIVDMPISERGLFCGDHCPCSNGLELGTGRRDVALVQSRAFTSKGCRVPKRGMSHPGG